MFIRVTVRGFLVSELSVPLDCLKFPLGTALRSFVLLGFSFLFFFQETIVEKVKFRVVKPLATWPRGPLDWSRGLLFTSRRALMEANIKSQSFSNCLVKGSVAPLFWRATSSDVMGMLKLVAALLTPPISLPSKLWVSSPVELVFSSSMLGPLTFRGYRVL